ncbi:MAG: glycoside hydrolase family 172 protein, partial [Planctomycetota bacterium]
MERLRLRHAWLIALVVLASGPAAADDRAETITLASLLEEMIDREVLARVPDPAYTCRQFSSYDRAARSPDEEWFANHDANQYLRTEENDGRQEWVLMDTPGPGAVVRIWSANPPDDGTLRIYLDGSNEPVIAAPMADLLGGKWRVAPPLSAVRSRGWNLYLPVPYAEHCKITCDKDGFYYQINYRTYEPGTRVESYCDAAAAEAKGAVARVQQVLIHPPRADGDRKEGINEMIEAGASASVPLGPGPRAIRYLILYVPSEDLPTALRSTILQIDFDGERTVWCPLGDFFGSGVGVNAYSGWWRLVGSRPTGGGGVEAILTCRWVMPYRESCRISIHNLSSWRTEVRLSAVSSPWDWDDRSMHFHTVWRQQNPIPTRPMRDWNYVEVRGKGVFVGDTLALANPVKIWWGEGDEKIYVDGEAFPSHFGTGTEDYYGYAWGSAEPFEAPFHAQPRCDGPGNYGHTTVSRVRSLDAIPFGESFRFDMEVWHWKECDIGYAATSHFYALPGATHNRPPQPQEAARGPLDPPPLPAPFHIEGALEAEKMKIVDRSQDFVAVPQGGFDPRLWSGEQQLWVQAQRVGDFIELEIPAGAGRRRLLVYATRSWDYAIVRFFVNGTRVGDDVDLFNTEGRAVAATGPIDLGVVRPVEGRLVLRVEVVGSNKRSEDPGTYFGIDCAVLT